MGAEDDVRGAGEDHGRRGEGGSGPAGGERLTETPTVIVPASRRPDASRRPLASLFAAGAERVLFVDDEGSASGGELAREFPGVEVIRTAAPSWWTGCIVLGVTRALERGDRAVLLFNQDVACAEDYFDRLAEAVARFPGALIGSAVLYAHDPGRVWSAGGAVEWWRRGIRGRHHGESVSALPAEPFEADWLFGMGTYVPCEAFLEVGLPDAGTFPQAWGDVDFTLRARRAGYRIVVEPRARLFHEVGDYDPRVAGAPDVRTYLGWLGDEKHNLSLSAHAALWRRHGPRLLWPFSLALRVAVLLANFVRIRLRFPEAPGHE